MRVAFTSSTLVASFLLPLVSALDLSRLYDRHYKREINSIGEYWSYTISHEELNSTGNKKEEHFQEVCNLFNFIVCCFQGASVKPLNPFAAQWTGGAFRYNIYAMEHQTGKMCFHYCNICKFDDHLQQDVIYYSWPDWHEWWWESQNWHDWSTWVKARSRKSNLT
jgi:hypothetical protein